MSKELEQYYLLKNFWSNLGMNANDIEELTVHKYEMLKSIMQIEASNEEKRMKKVASKYKNG